MPSPPLSLNSSSALSAACLLTRCSSCKDLSAADGVKYYVAVIGSAFSGLLVNVFTDPFLGYFRNRYIFGQEADLASTVAKITSGVTLINSLLSTVCAVVLFLALVPALRKANLLPTADKPE